MPPSFDSSAASHRPGDWRTIARLLPYLWEYKWRVIIAIACMVAAKSANVGVPLLLKQLIDAMDVPAGSAQALLVVPVGLLVAYGALRFANSLFNELREFVFSKATHSMATSPMAMISCCPPLSSDRLVRLLSWALRSCCKLVS